MRKINLHNHTTFSDGKKTPKELVEEAINKKLDEVAISDHYESFLGIWGFKSNVLLYKSDIFLYFKVLNHLKEKYRDKIKIFAGLEMDLKLIDEADLPYEHFKDLDFILFERVHTFEDLEKLIKLKKEIPIRVGLAHPTFDKFKNKKKIVDVLEKNNIFVELNTSCYFYYSPQDRPDLPEHPLVFEKQEDFFKLIRNRKINISIGADVHRTDDDVNEVDKAYKYLDKMGLNSNLIKL